MAAELVQSPVTYFTLPISVNGFQNLTLAALVYVDGLNPEVPRGLIGTRTTTDASGYAQIVQRSDNQWSAQAKIDAADADQYTNVGGEVAVGWQFVALTIGVDCRFYLNHNAPVVFTRSSANALSGHPDCKIGYYYDGVADSRWRFAGKVSGAYVVPSALTSGEIAALATNFWSGVKSERKLYFGTSGGTGTTTERTVAARTKARGAATTTAIHAATTAGRIRARAADVVVPIHVETVAGRVTARGADARTSIHAGTAAGRIKARGTDTVAPLRTESAAGRIRAKATNTVEHIDAGAVSRTIAGKVRARGAAATLAIRHTSIVGRVQARGADTVTSTRLSLAAGRVRTRAAIAAAPVVAGMVVTTAAGRIQARGAIATTATRIEAIAGRVTARGTDTANSIRTAVTAGRLRSRGRATAGPYVAPTLPLEVPESTRVLVDKTERLGASPSPTIWDPVLNRRVPAPRKPPRLG